MNQNKTSRVLDRCKELLETFYMNATDVSLYESPGDILYMGNTLISTLVSSIGDNGIYNGQISIYCYLTDDKYNIQYSWGGDDHSKNASEMISGNVIPASSKGKENLEVTQTYDIENHIKLVVRILSYHDCTSDSEFINSLLGLLMNSWGRLTEEIGRDLISFVSYGQASDLNADDYSLDTSALEKKLSYKMRDALQRLEELLPEDYRVRYSKDGDILPSQCFFMRNESISHNNHFPPGTSYIMTYEDLRVLDNWLCLDEGSLFDDIKTVVSWLAKYKKDNSIYADAEAELKRIVKMQRDDAILEIRDIYESHQSLTGLDRSPGIYKTIKTGSTIVTNDSVTATWLSRKHSTRTENMIDLIASILLYLSCDKDLSLVTGTLSWPVKVIGKPVLYMQLYLSGSSPLVVDKECYEDFKALLQAVIDINQEAVNVFSDIYILLFSEFLGYTLLDCIFKHDGSRADDDELIDDAIIQLNNMSSILYRYMNIPPLLWNSLSDNQEMSLYSIRSRVEIRGGARSYEGMKHWDAIRHFKIRSIRKLLSKIFLDVPYGKYHTQPHIVFLYDQLIWKIGDYLTNRLPDILMLVDNTAQYYVTREREIYRHELSGLIAASRDLALKIGTENPNNKLASEKEDLILVTRMTHQMLLTTSATGCRRIGGVPGKASDIGDFFRSIRRIFNSLFVHHRIGDSGIFEIVDCICASSKVNIYEHDLYAIWKNIWVNARSAVIEQTQSCCSDHTVNQAYNSNASIATASSAPPVLLTILRKLPSNYIEIAVVDNAPALAGSAIRYHRDVQFGHYGSEIVQSIVEQLREIGILAEYREVTRLPEDIAKEYESIELLVDYNWQPSFNWSWTCVRLPCI